MSRARKLASFPKEGKGKKNRSKAQIDKGERSGSGEKVKEAGNKKEDGEETGASEELTTIRRLFFQSTDPIRSPSLS